jgi:Uncharacterized conserved protein, contains FHA domain
MIPLKINSFNHMKTITIGRSSQCDIILSDGNISRIHAEIFLNNGQYVYFDKSNNGSNVGGQIINNKKIVVAPETNILLANKIPLPWDRVYTLLPLSRHSVNEAETMHHVNYHSTHIQKVPYHQGNQADYPVNNDKLSIGWGILAFLIPLAGLIMYFVWKDETPSRANAAGIVGIISFILNIILFAGI